MKHFENFDLSNIVEEINGIVYTEQWKDIKGYEGIYQISDFGRVKSLAKAWSVGKKGDTILKSGSHKQGYRNVTLCVDKVKSVKLVHRLVASHYCKNENNYKIVNHLDSVTNNNFKNNLEWTTYTGNAIHGFNFGFRIGRKGSSHHNVKLTELEILEIKKVYKTGNYSQKKVADLFKISQTHVQRIISGKRWNHIK